MEVIQGVISHINQYSLVAIDLESYDAEFDTTVILETEFHENNNIFNSHQDKRKRNWKSFLQ